MRSWVNAPLGDAIRFVEAYADADVDKVVPTFTPLDVTRLAEFAAAD